MSSVAESTVALWSPWQSHRDELQPFGSCCAKARQGALPGAVPVTNGTHRVRLDRVPEALAAMRKEAA